MKYPKGLEFRDPEGNLVWTLTKDKYSGEIIEAKDFISPDGNHPIPGTDIPEWMHKQMGHK